MKKILGIAALAALAGTANGQILINEVLGSTGGSDAEFIELVNAGGSAVDISGYEIELWDSDIAAIPGTDAASPYVISNGVTLNPGEVYTLANDLALGFGGVYTSPNATTYNGQPFNRDQTLGSNSIENSAYTIILVDGSGGSIVDALYFSDGGEGDGDYANRNGTPIVPSVNVPLDGSFLAPGYARTDYVGGGTLLHFSTPGFGPPELNDGTIEGGTPGINQVPAPGAFALLGAAGLVGVRRRRA